MRNSEFYEFSKKYFEFVVFMALYFLGIVWLIVISFIYFNIVMGM